MSTRGAIARPSGEGFVGRYHHWDGYPEGLGTTLYNLRNGFFGGDTDAMLKVLLDDHPAGWSTINNKDFNRVPGFKEHGSDAIPCVAVIDGKPCGKGHNAHFCQYHGYAEGHGQPYPCVPNNYGSHIGHAYVDDAVIRDYMNLIPECYCHGDRTEEAWEVTAENASGSGVEFAYVLEGPRMLVLGSYGEDGGKSIGMFGMGDPDASWRILADVNMDEPMTATDWSAIQEKAWPSEDAA